MNFDNTENAVLRYIKCDEDFISVRFTDGVLFKWKIPIYEKLKPSDVVSLFSALSEDIKERYKDPNENEVWSEYDTNGNLIHYNSDGYEEWKEYDTNGNLIHYKKHNGYEEWKEYDTNGNLIHHKDSSGGEWRITISI